MTFDSTGCFHWCSSRSVEECTMTRQEVLIIIITIIVIIIIIIIMIIMIMTMTIFVSILMMISMSVLWEPVGLLVFIMNLENWSE